MRIIKEPETPVKGIVLDIDGALHSGQRREDFLSAGAEKELLFLSQRLGKTVDEVKLVISEKRNNMTHSLGRSVSSSEVVLELGILPDEWNSARHSCYEPEKYLRPDPNLVEAVTNLLQYYPIVFTTNNPRELGCRVLQVLGFKELDQLIVVGPEDTNCPKPKVDYFNYAISKLNGLLPRDLLILSRREDIDLHPAITVGIGCAIHVERIEESINIFLGLRRFRELNLDRQIFSLPQFLFEHYKKGKITIIGLTGQGGAGKTTVAKRLYHLALRHKIPVHLLGLDSFFILSSNDRKKWLLEGEKISDEEMARRRNQLTWWDYDKVNTALKGVRNGQEIILENVYNREDKGELTGKVQIPATDERGLLLLFEGVAIVHLKQWFDKLIFLYTPKNIRFERMLARDKERRPAYNELIARFQLIESFEREYFLHRWPDIDLPVDCSSIQLSLTSGLSVSDALDLSEAALAGISRRTLSE